MSHHSRHINTHAPQSAATENSPRVGGADAPNVQPDAERIRLRAYEISQARKGEQGSPLTDWVQAEQELRAGSESKR